MSVQEYIDKHELTKVVEDAVNAAVKVKPDEPLSFLVRICLHAVTARSCEIMHASRPAAEEAHLRCSSRHRWRPNDGLHAPNKIGVDSACLP